MFCAWLSVTKSESVAMTQTKKVVEDMMRIELEMVIAEREQEINTLFILLI